jgi:hypothetical protein
MNRFSGYRLPLMTDNLDEDVRFAAANGGDGCLSVASGDFDGDGDRDFAVGLTPTSEVVPLVAVALSRGDGWHLSTLRSWVDDRERLYVAAVPSGVYTRTDSLDTPLERGETERLRCRHAAIEVGATESSAIVYCYANKRWTYVWVSD